MTDRLSTDVPPSALERRDELARRLAGRRLVVFLDYDGTLTPIVARPELAILSDAMRETLRQLAAMVTVAVVSGRDRADVERLVGLNDLIYAGSHGFDIAGPGGLAMEHEEGTARLPDLDAAEQKLQERLGGVAGAQVERKKFAIAVHYRNVADEDFPAVERAVDAVHAEHPALRKRGGKKIFELQPDVPWDKGRAVLFLLEALGLDRADVLPLYVGDDLTDEDAFLALRDRGVGVLVGPPTQPTHATYTLQNPEECRTFLEALAQPVH